MHDQGTMIEIWRPEANVVLACIRLTAWRYAQKDANVFDQTTILGTGIQIQPSAVPVDVLSLLPGPKGMRL